MSARVPLTYLDEYMAEIVHFVTSKQEIITEREERARNGEDAKWLNVESLKTRQLLIAHTILNSLCALVVQIQSAFIGVHPRFDFVFSRLGGMRVES